jgi:hypothetical protein
VAALTCVIGGPTPAGATSAPATEPTATPRPLNTGGQDRYNCEDFATWQEADAVFQANKPGDPNRLDHNKNGVPCESLSGSPISGGNPE